ncbi:unnamed protein product [Miscanthus lutarioriparius]|uniref:IAA-alanine resistance protein 1 n=1 Tax=Miscanthus lutarioriparius TaxID=422564 RepID=A0A811SL75_9POAL|nr:unnamed protein product [Miscanthus lutarioriparius]
MRRRSLAAALLLLAAAAALAAPAAGNSESSCSFHDHGGHDEPHEHHHHGHSCGGGADHEHHHHHHGHGEIQRLLPEEMAEEADLELESFGYDEHDHDHHHHHHHHGHDDTETSPMGVWLSAMGCSLLVSMASLVCLVLLPVIIFFQGKPSKAIVDSLAVFGGTNQPNSATKADKWNCVICLKHMLDYIKPQEQCLEIHFFISCHMLLVEDIHISMIMRVMIMLMSMHMHTHWKIFLWGCLYYVSISYTFGIVLFFIVEKIVRYVEDNSQNGAHSMDHGHHHHNHKRHDSSDKAKLNHQKSDTDGKDIDHTEEEPLVDGATGKISDGQESKATIRKHNFTDGMALGSAFLLHGSVGGWSRTLFLLAHELPQEVGDFGILVRSGFTVSKALFFNFLSALVALAGTALALSLGKDPGHSSLIEGFTAGGFIYIAVAGVLPQMNDQKTTLKSSVAQLISLAMGMLIALGISLVE